MTELTLTEFLLTRIAEDEWPDPDAYAEQAEKSAYRAALTALASVYADRPDFREEWAL